MNDAAFQQCVMPSCAANYALDEVLFSCKKCGALLDVRYDWSRIDVPSRLSFFDDRRVTSGRSREARVDASGVWRFRELLPFAPMDDLVTVGEGRTILQQADGLAGEVGMHAGCLSLEYEGFNPSGSFKDNGMVAAFTVARALNRSRVACASTGNTSASLAMVAAQTTTRDGQPMDGIVFVGGGKISLGKLSQALDYGARTIQIAGDFDACIKLVQAAADRLGLYLMNSVNPFRLEGQKAIMYRVLEELNWEVPDWVIVPGGNLGNSSAFGKAFAELRELGLIDRLPRLAIINAAGASALCDLYEDRGLRFNGGAIDQDMIDTYFSELRGRGWAAKTIASAIEIGLPVNLVKALRSLDAMQGVVRRVTDEEILNGKALVGRFGYGCEPASGASVAGLRLLLADGTISRDDRVVCILTGHGLKDPAATIDYHQQQSDGDRRPHANPPVPCADDLEEVVRLVGGPAAKV